MPLWGGASVPSPEAGQSCPLVAVALGQGELEPPQVVNEPRLSAQRGQGLSKHRGDQVTRCRDQREENVAGEAKYVLGGQDAPAGAWMCPAQGVSVESQPVVPRRPHGPGRVRGSQLIGVGVYPGPPMAERGPKFPPGERQRRRSQMQECQKPSGLGHSQGAGREMLQIKNL